MSHFINCFIFFISLQLTWAQNWPSPEACTLFTPLDAKNGVKDIVHGTEPESVRPELETSKTGPFGIPDSSYTVYAEPSYICFFHDFELSNSFTVSTYYYRSGRAYKAGVFMAAYNVYRFSMAYKGDALEVFRYNYGVGNFGGKFVIDRFFNDWTFICMTFDDTTKTATLYDEAGNIIHVERNFPILPSTENTRLFLGVARDESNNLNQYKGDAMACTMVYNKVLTAEEISQLPEVCRLKGTAPPSTTSTTTTPTTTTTSETTTTTTATTSTTTEGTTEKPVEPLFTPWPDPENLLGLWPLSSNYKLFDVSGSNFRTVTLAFYPNIRNSLSYNI